MAQDYCSPGDLFAHGLPRGSVPNPGRQVSAVDATANTLTLDVHGFSLDDEVVFRVEAGGALPSGLTAGVYYYVIPVTEATFQVSATPSGAAVDLGAGATPGRILCIARLSIPEIISGMSRAIDDMLPGHIVPIEGAVPPIVTMTCAELSAEKVLALTGGPSKGLMTIFDAAHKRLAQWAKGVPIRGEGGQQQAGGAVSASVPYADPRKWNSHGGL